MKTLMPQYFNSFDPENDFKGLFSVVSVTLLPNLTEDHYRIHMLHLNEQYIDSSMYFKYYKYVVTLCEYMRNHDYCDGFISILDYRKVNILDSVTKMNLIELRDMVTVAVEGYGMRLKGIHILSGSKVVDTLVKLFKQVLSEKIGGRIRVHKTLDTLYEYVPKNMLPVEYGGQEKSLKILSDELYEVLSSKDHINYLKEMSKAVTDESYRQSDKFNEQYIGMPGSFRTLSVD